MISFVGFKTLLPQLLVLEEIDFIGSLSLCD